MPRPRRDGAPSATPDKRKLTEIFIRKLSPKPSVYLVWDAYQHGLALQVQPTGRKSWKCIYRKDGRPRWYTIGDAAELGLADARKLANKVMFKVAEGADPAADRKAERGRGTFEELAKQYVEVYAKRRNRSWEQADALVQKHLVPRWSKLQAASISRTDVRTAIAAIAAPVVANQTLSAASAIFNWAIREEIVSLNPCARVERNATKSRERVLSESELSKFWVAFEKSGFVKCNALRMILLTGQRPGEVRFMRREHIIDGWWEMPGEPVEALQWPGTKNKHSHRVWLPIPAQEILAAMPDEGQIFGGVSLDTAMRKACAALDAEAKEFGAHGVLRTTPHDLRRTHGTTITALGFGRDGMNRVQNHIEGGIASVYDRHEYAEENKKIMEAVARKIVALVQGGGAPPAVVPLVSRLASR